MNTLIQKYLSYYERISQENPSLVFFFFFFWVQLCVTSKMFLFLQFHVIRKKRAQDAISDGYQY